MVLPCMVLFELAASAGSPKNIPLPATIPASVVLFVAPLMVQFFIVLFVAPSDEDALASHITAAVFVALVFIILRLLPPLFKPSMVTWSAPFNFIIAPLGFVPVNTAAIPASGLIVSVKGPAPQV